MRIVRVGGGPGGLAILPLGRPAVQVEGAETVHLGGYGVSTSRQQLLDLLALRGRSGRPCRRRAGTRRPCAAGRRRPGRNKYVWLGTSKLSDAFTSAFVPTDAGWIWFHAYGLSNDRCTCIIECAHTTSSTSGPAPSWPWRTRSGWPPAWTSTRTSSRRSRPTGSAIRWYCSCRRGRRATAPSGSSPSRATSTCRLRSSQRCEAASLPCCSLRSTAVVLPPPPAIEQVACGAGSGSSSAPDAESSMYAA
jgi:hypothetical protein